jgi:hypothetical protein
MNQNELEEIILLNLKVNSFILSVLSNSKDFPFNKSIVIKLLEDIQKILNSIEKNKGEEK